MVAPGRPGKATKLGGQWPSHSPSPIPPSSSQDSETESATFPPFEQDGHPAADGAPSNDAPAQDTGYASSRSRALAPPPPPKKNMAIPEFYATPSGAGRDKSRAKVHIIPHRRSERQTTSLDLSISAGENEGLGVYTNYDRDRRNTDSFAAVASRTAHQRSSSGASQFSATTVPGPNGPGTQYVYPMRHARRSYTPALSRSNQTSTVESEASDGRNSAAFDRSAIPGGHEPFNYRSSSLGSRSHADSPYLMPSQTNDAGGASSSRSRTIDSSNIHEPVSPVSRSSLDFAFRTKSRTSTGGDPVDRAAAIKAARQAFEDREAEKARKLEKAQDKELKRKERKKQERLQEQTVKQQQPPPQGPQQHDPDMFRRTQLSDFTFRNHREHHNENSSRPEGSARRSSDPRGHTAHGSGEKEHDGPKLKNPKSSWLLFLTWLRTRMFKMRRKIKNKAGC